MTQEDMMTSTHEIIPQEALPQDAAPSISLTEMQIRILARGMNDKEFKLERNEIGRSSGALVARGLIKPHKKGIYRLTSQGHVTYALILQGHAAVLDRTAIQIDSASGLNLNDAALVQSPALLLAEQRLKRIVQLEKTVDDLGALIDQRDTQIEGLRRSIDAMKTKAKAGR